MSIRPYPKDSIGIFDSGLGGLTVLKALKEILPHENFLYLADTARIPYGDKTTSTITRYAEECLQFLVQKQAKMIVIACHTVSSVALETLTARFEIPIVGTIGPSLQLIRSLSNSQKLALLATKRTIDAGVYERILLEQKTIERVLPVPCPLFVPLIEEGYLSHPMCNAVVEKTLSPLKKAKPTSLLLGCTHFPFLKDSIQKIFPKVQILDPAESIAFAVKEKLISLNLENPSLEKRTTRFFVTDDPNRFSFFASQFISMETKEVELAVLP